MAAILGMKAKKIEAVIAENGYTGIGVANYTSLDQIVISGVSEQIKEVLPHLEAAGASACIPLPVSAAFHSHLMADAADEFEEFLADFNFLPLKKPVVANFTGRPYPDGDPSSVIRWMLVQQICGSVQWMDTITYLMQKGCTEFVELGPGQVLTKLIGKIRGTNGL